MIKKKSTGAWVHRSYKHKLAGYSTKILLLNCHLSFFNGCRITSSTVRLNSGNSSKNKTPLCANDISPGCGIPPPTSATSLMGMMWRSEWTNEINDACCPFCRQQNEFLWFPMPHAMSMAAIWLEAALPAWFYLHRRTNQYYIVPSCCCNFQRTFNVFLTFNITEIKLTFFLQNKTHRVY